jgi:hypothetical protein
MKAVLTFAGKSFNVDITDVQANTINEAALPITERVKSYVDACQVLNLHPDRSLPYMMDTEDPEQKNDNAHKKLKIIARALNEGWKPNWKDSNESKWMPYFNMNPTKKEDPSGFGLAFDYTYRWRAVTVVGARLLYKDSATAEYAGKQFIAIYADMLVN